MNETLAKSRKLEPLLAAILYYGTWLASIVVAVGLLGDYVRGTADMRVVTVGIALFILLPIIRVIMMMIVFILERDYRFGMIAAAVLAIILMSCLLGMLPARLS